jgi:hypothetical protein
LTVWPSKEKSEKTEFVDEQAFLQLVFNTDRGGQPCPADMVLKAEPFIKAGMIRRGADSIHGAVYLTVPAETQQQLAIAGCPLKLR